MKTRMRKWQKRGGVSYTPRVVSQQRTTHWVEGWKAPQSDSGRSDGEIKPLSFDRAARTLFTAPTGRCRPSYSCSSVKQKDFRMPGSKSWSFIPSLWLLHNRYDLNVSRGPYATLWNITAARWSKLLYFLFFWNEVSVKKLPSVLKHLRHFLYLCTSENCHTLLRSLIFTISTI
jgi:hypothetical protein